MKEKNKKIKKVLFIELGIIILALILYIFVYNNIADKLPSCFVYQNFGIECPSCGGTRCVSSFITGNFYESLLFHPVFFFTIIYFIFINIIYMINIFRKKEILTWLYPKKDFWIGFIIILFIFTIIRNIM